MYNVTVVDGNRLLMNVLSDGDSMSLSQPALQGKELLSVFPPHLLSVSAGEMASGIWEVGGHAMACVMTVCSQYGHPSV